jgi:signal transduction histidine kinase
MGGAGRLLAGSHHAGTPAADQGACAAVVAAATQRGGSVTGPERLAGAAGGGRLWLLAGATAGAAAGLLAAALGWWPATALLLLLSALAGAAVQRAMANERQRSASISADNARLVDRLRASLRRLRESNRLKDDFVAAVSHELRSPLTAIQGSLSTLLRDDIDLDATTARSLLETADRQSRRLHRLIEDLLVVSLLESGADRPRLGDVHLSVLLGQVLEELGADGRHLVETDVPAGLGPVRSDADRLHQILANLIGNARKYAPAGTTITVRVRPGPAAVDVLVADQGPGIPPEARERIFERFYQFDQSRTRRAGGVGLGLYLCRRLAASIGAEVALERTGPGGSVFAVRLPNPPGAVPTPPDDPEPAGAIHGGTGATAGPSAPPLPYPAALGRSRRRESA